MSDPVVAFSRSGNSDPFGQCVEEVKTHVPEQTKLELMQRANQAGVSVSEIVRYWINCHLYGEEHVARLSHDRMMGRRAGDGAE